MFAIGTERVGASTSNGRTRSNFLLLLSPVAALRVSIHVRSNRPLPLLPLSCLIPLLLAVILLLLLAQTLQVHTRAIKPMAYVAAESLPACWSRRKQAQIWADSFMLVGNLGMHHSFFIFTYNFHYCPYQ